MQVREQDQDQDQDQDQEQDQDDDAFPQKTHPYLPFLYLLFFKSGTV